MNQADLSIALTKGKMLRVMLTDGRTLQGVLEETYVETSKEPCRIQFRSALNLPPKTHTFMRPEDVISVEVIPSSNRDRVLLDAK